MSLTASSKPIELLRLLASRLERLSVDSRWARRASGLRGNIVKVLEEAESRPIASERIELLISRSFEILRAAAQEIPDLEEMLRRSLSTQEKNEPPS
ncbi:MAG: hypothetical protein N2049_10970 [Anaerolineales bacterium]|nr:hypothetical protein [Anaerolineales bacterium]MCX7609719.1 hypothetical protein [Anaerolineales bacterium]MDW8226749.1 hypothetical protein [Anaerolineales bacterium]